MHALLNRFVFSSKWVSWTPWPKVCFTRGYEINLAPEQLILLWYTITLFLRDWSEYVYLLRFCFPLFPVVHTNTIDINESCTLKFLLLSTVRKLLTSNGSICHLISIGLLPNFLSLHSRNEKKKVYMKITKQRNKTEITYYLWQYIDNSALNCRVLIQNRVRSFSLFGIHSNTHPLL